MRSILKNSTFLLLAQALVKIISFFYTIFLANFLGVSNFGYYVTALAYFSLISAISDFGFNRFLIREGSRDQTVLSKMVGVVSLLRIVLVTLICLIFWFWIKGVDPDSERISLSTLAVMAVLPQSIALTFDAALVARQRIGFSALGLLILSTVTTGVGIYLILSGYETSGALISLILGQVVYFLVLFIFLRQTGVSFKLLFDKETLRKILNGSVPYGIISVLGLLYFRIDTLLISYIRGVEETGIYGAAYRFLEAVIFIPSALATAMFPVVVNLHDKNPGEIKKLYFKSVGILFVLSLPILIIYLYFLPQLIERFLPAFIGSIAAIKILSWTIPFIFIHVPGALVLISGSKYLWEVIYLSLFTLSFNIIFNIIFLPSFGFIAAAYITVASEALSFLVFFILLYKRILKDG
ncbi:MAG: flippase [Candidatus Daviesbacteria bacterium]|nr:flippase [Candidatus Daviesbacteria bacterium]